MTFFSSQNFPEVTKNHAAELSFSPNPQESANQCILREQITKRLKDGQNGIELEIFTRNAGTLFELCGHDIPFKNRKLAQLVVKSEFRCE